MKLSRFLSYFLVLCVTIVIEGDCGCSGAKLSRNGDLINNTINVTQVDESRVQLFERSSEVKFNLNSKMVFIKGGNGVIGTDKPIMKGDGESPKREVTLSPFYMDKYEVSNEGILSFCFVKFCRSNAINSDYKAFVDETSFVTESEQFGWSFVFESAIADEIKKDITEAVLGAEWWLPVNGSYWREPEGPGSDVFSPLRDRSNYAVVHVSWNDAMEFCRWRGGRLPREAEWEHAAKGPENANSGDSPSLFPWGNSLTPRKQHRANIFQGSFPTHNSAEDGFEFISPVDAFPPQNSYGLHNMIGNVWEWVEDWFTTQHLDEDDGDDHRAVPHNPTGPLGGREKVKKGGSFLCHKSFCYRYRTAARFPSTPDSATYNVGFRCAMDTPPDWDAQQETITEQDDEL
jgi:sulfatase modifying factor 1